jgi:hypothetical protein
LRIEVFLDCWVVVLFPPLRFISEILVSRRPVRFDSLEVKHGISWPDIGCRPVVLLPVSRGVRCGFRCGPAGAARIGRFPSPSNGAPGIPPDVLTIPQLPVPPNSSFAIDDTVLVGNDDDWTGQVILNAPFSVIQVTQFYRTEMPKMGWAETAIVRARRTSISFVRDQRVATIRISIQKDDNKRTDIDVVVSPIQTKLAPGTSSTMAPMVPRLK